MLTVSDVWNQHHVTTVEALLIETENLKFGIPYV